MSLSLEQKSLYLILYDRTQVERSIALTLSEKELKEFKIAVFQEIEGLTDRMDRGELSEEDIVCSFDSLCSRFGVSFGQAQKPINVILKHHFYITQSRDARTKATLHCPIDSVVLGELGRRDLCLARLARDAYLAAQKEVEDRGATRLDFDRVYDEQNLRYWGIL